MLSLASGRRMYHGQCFGRVRMLSFFFASATFISMISPKDTCVIPHFSDSIRRGAVDGSPLVALPNFMANAGRRRLSSAESYRGCRLLRCACCLWRWICGMICQFIYRFLEMAIHSQSDQGQKKEVDESVSCDGRCKRLLLPPKPPTTALKVQTTPGPFPNPKCVRVTRRWAFSTFSTFRWWLGGRSNRLRKGQLLITRTLLGHYHAELQIKIFIFASQCHVTMDATTSGLCSRADCTQFAAPVYRGSTRPALPSGAHR